MAQKLGRAVIVMASCVSTVLEFYNTVLINNLTFCYDMEVYLHNINEIRFKSCNKFFDKSQLTLMQ